MAFKVLFLSIMPCDSSTAVPALTGSISPFATPIGYAANSPPDAALALARLSPRVVRSRFGNGTSEWYKFIQEADGDNIGGFAIGSSSENYITNTHSFYLPNPQTKAFVIHFAKYCE